MDILGTASAVTTIGSPDGEVEIKMLDWTINGVPLRSLMGEQEPPDPLQETTWLREDDPPGALDALRRLLDEKPGDFPDGRVSLLVCPVCADLGCGSVSASLQMSDQTARWVDLAFQVDYEPLDSDGEDLAAAPSFSFDAAQYRGLLGQLMRDFEALPQRRVDPAARLPSRRRRRFWRRS